ncbi:DUF4870 family protein [Govanella unica]|uniref:Transmembrane protein n=1 Tax=Govanella unica TaxID=2975056 RepID=A0A9X3TVI2_9PROT|nr:hypothetical protein [Govania unica]MDA5192494.1 hypothetical protein [Govania unica]
MTEPTAETPNTGPSQQPVIERSGPELARNLDMLLLTYVAFLLGLVTGWCGAIVGVIIAYLKRDEVVGTWRESHYTWLIRTFWIGLLFVVIGWATIWFLVGFLVFFLTFLWVVIRLIKGWIAYSNEQPITKPDAWFIG